MLPLLNADAAVISAFVKGIEVYVVADVDGVAAIIVAIVAVTTAVVVVILTVDAVFAQCCCSCHRCFCDKDLKFMLLQLLIVLQLSSLLL